VPHGGGARCLGFPFDPEGLAQGGDMRRAARRDANDGIISEALRVAGFTVHDFASAGNSIPDKLVSRPLPDGRQWICWVEIKAPGGRLRPGQERFRDIFQPRHEWYEARDAQDTVCELANRYYESIKQEHLR